MLANHMPSQNAVVMCPLIS